MSLLTDHVFVNTLDSCDSARLRAVSETAETSAILSIDDQLRESSRWLDALQAGLGHTSYLLKMTKNERTVGALPLSLVSSALFGRFLVSLPYVNSAGVWA